MTTHHTDVAIVGAGILGLAFARAAARQGRRVTVFERDHRAVSASVRNFGMVWPIGQQPGRVHARALRTRALWDEVIAESGVWSDPCGSLHLARTEAERTVLREFADNGPDQGYRGEFLEPDAVVARWPMVRRQGLCAGLFSPTELCVFSPEVIARLPRVLHEQYGVAFEFGCAVSEVGPGELATPRARWKAERIVVCSGSDFETLFPDHYARAGLVRCKLQMLRTRPQPGRARIGTMIAGGLTQLHYACFDICPSLDRVRAHYQAHLPAYLRHGIHVMASQHGDSRVTIGDSHEYGQVFDPFASDEIDAMILDYLAELIELPEPRIDERWTGVYTKGPGLTEFVAAPDPSIRLVSLTSGNGMTTSFGLAEEVWNGWDA